MYDVDGIGVYAAKDLAAVDAGECGSAIAYISNNWGENGANANLISAAPEMLAALRKAADAIGDWGRPKGSNGMTSAPPDHPLMEAMRVAYAVIEKAEGRS